MVHIIGIALQCIGWILLGILFLVALLLLVPIRYTIEGEIDSEEKMRKGQARFRWLFSLVSGYARYEEGRVSWKAHILWWRWPKKKSVRSKREKKKQEVSKKEKRYTFSSICDKIKEIRYKKQEVMDFVKEEEHKKAWFDIWKIVKRFWRQLKPKKLEGFVRFGLEDPYDTGRILVALAIFYFTYGDYVEVVPDFEKPILVGEIRASGRLQLLWILILALRLGLNDSIMKTYEDFRKFGKGKKRSHK